MDGDDEEKKTGDYLLIPGGEKFFKDKKYQSSVKNKKNINNRIFTTAGVSANMKDKDKVKHLRSDYYCGVGLGDYNYTLLLYPSEIKINVKFLLIS